MDRTVHPLEPGEVRAAGQPAATSVDEADPSAAPPVSPTDPAPAPPEAAGDRLRSTVQGVLDRYDRAITALHADPGALLRAGDPLTGELAGVVQPGSALDADLRSDLADRLATGTVVRPPTTGALSWVHHATAATEPVDGASAAGESTTIEFEWCSWSPGVAVVTASGAVDDDGVGHATGVGTIIRDRGGWALGTLDQTSLEVLPAGSGDPCPVE